MATNTTSAQQRHRSALQQYLRSHTNVKPIKKPPEYSRPESSSTTQSHGQVEKISANSNNLPSKNTPKLSSSLKGKSTKVRLTLPHIPRGGGVRTKASFESLPDEIIAQIFWKLQVSDLISAAQVCKRWYKVAGDNLLWKHYYARFVGPTSKEKEDKMAIQELDSSCWKNLCLKRCKIKRDNIYLKKWNKPDTYTGLRQRPELTLGKVGVQFELSILDTSGLTRSIKQNEIFWQTTSTSIRWYDLTFPDLNEIRGVKVHACSPLMFYGPSKPAKDGIVQKSLLLEYRGNLRKTLNEMKPLGSDSHIKLFELLKGLIIGIYQADGEIAFLTASLHYYRLISKCLCGAPDRVWTPQESEGIMDDIDPHYGLHGYTCVLQVRNMRQKLLDCKFTHLHTTKQMLENGFASFNPVHKDDKMSHVACIKDIALPWKTNLFKGIIKDVGILDITLLDERGEPFWTVASAVSVEQTSQTNQFEFDRDNYKIIQYSDEIGKIVLEFGKLDDGSQYLSSAVISLSVNAINKTFCTSY
ncbi:F-box only protein 15-like [Physella acuta]|uniref:F-box only protein 15-like n=1 Tax=Physella acuta TaxID=109671 RepID=UPI0027DD8926|nr:F-box only protein 15-like [Physella acuta]